MILKWRNKGLVTGEVMTYHYGGQVESLYVCLSVPKVGIPPSRSIFLDKKTIEKIPLEIKSTVHNVIKENPEVKVEYRDYEYAIHEEKAKKDAKGESYYDGAPVKEILRFASTGTKIALEILETLRNNTLKLDTDQALVHHIFKRLEEEFGDNYKWIHWAVHFVCNPLLASERYIWSLRLKRLPSNLMRKRELVNHLTSLA